jgi:hypothetical protein
MRRALPFAMILALAAALAPRAAVAGDPDNPAGPPPNPAAGCGIGPQLVQMHGAELAATQAAVTTALGKVQADLAAAQRAYTQALTAKQHAATAAAAAARFDTPGGAAQSGDLFAALQDEDQAAASLSAADQALKAVEQDRTALAAAQAALLTLMGCAAPNPRAQ